MRNWPSVPPCKDDNAWFTMVPLKALSDRVEIRNECLQSWKKNYFQLFFFTKWRWTSPGECTDCTFHIGFTFRSCYCLFTSWSTRRCPWHLKNRILKKKLFRIFISYVTLWVPMGFLKKFKPKRSSCLANNSKHIESRTDLTEDWSNSIKRRACLRM